MLLYYQISPSVTWAHAVICYNMLDVPQKTQERLSPLKTTNIQAENHATHRQVPFPCNRTHQQKVPIVLAHQVVERAVCHTIRQVGLGIFKRYCTRVPLISYLAKAASSSKTFLPLASWSLWTASGTCWQKKKKIILLENNENGTAYPL